MDAEDIRNRDEHEYFATHCASCGKKNGRLVRIYCGECFHPYLIPVLGLVWHDMKVRIQINWKRDALGNLYNNSGRWKYRLKSLIPKQIKNIYSCPCCIHDL